MLHLSYKKLYFLYSDLSELESVGTEVVMVYFKLLLNHSFGVTDVNHKNR
jgi:hypothetical protein